MYNRYVISLLLIQILIDYCNRWWDSLFSCCMFRPVKAAVQQNEDLQARVRGSQPACAYANYWLDPVQTTLYCLHGTAAMIPALRHTLLRRKPAAPCTDMHNLLQLKEVHACVLQGSLLLSHAGCRTSLLCCCAALLKLSRNLEWPC